MHALVDRGSCTVPSYAGSCRAGGGLSVLPVTSWRYNPPRPTQSLSSPPLKADWLGFLGKAWAVCILVSSMPLPADAGDPRPDDTRAEPSGVRPPLEAHSSYRADDWSPQRLMFHHNLESFAERVGLLVGLQSNGKVSQEQAFAEIRDLWKNLKDSRSSLLSSDD